MSWLMRNGTGRNNIVWGGGSTTSGNYLRRTGTGRNNISYINISTSGTYNLLERTSTGRNNIRWNNLTFSFGPNLSKYPLDTHYYMSSSDSPYNITWYSGSTLGWFFFCRKVYNNGYPNISEIMQARSRGSGNYIQIYYQKGVAQNARNEMLKSTNVTIIGLNNAEMPFSYSAKPVKSYSKPWSNKEIRISVDEYDDFDVITLDFSHLLSQGNFPTLQSITFS